MGYETVFWSTTVSCLKGKKRWFWSMPCFLCLVQLRINSLGGRQRNKVVMIGRSNKDMNKWQKMQGWEVDKKLFKLKISSENWFDYSNRCWKSIQFWTFRLYCLRVLIWFRFQSKQQKLFLGMHFGSGIGEIHKKKWV